MINKKLIIRQAGKSVIEIEAQFVAFLGRDMDDDIVSVTLDMSRRDLGRIAAGIMRALGLGELHYGG